MGELMFNYPKRKKFDGVRYRLHGRTELEKDAKKTQKRLQDQGCSAEIFKADGADCWAVYVPLKR